MTILETLVKLRDNLKLWCINNLNSKLNKNLGSEESNKLLATNENGDIATLNTVPITKGGTGANTLEIAKSNLGIANLESILRMLMDNSTLGLAYELSGDSYICTGIGTTTENDIKIASNIISVPITAVGDNAFLDCSSLTSIVIPDSVISIGTNAFSGCASLEYNEYDNAYYLGNESNPYLCLVKVKSKDVTSCTIHENTKVVHSFAFENCISLKRVTIYNNIIEIGNYAFSGCTSISHLTYSGTKNEWENVSKGEGNGCLVQGFISYSDGTDTPITPLD